MAKLSETFKLAGGSNTAPVSNTIPTLNNQSQKLSDTFTLGQPMSLYQPTKSTPTVPTLEQPTTDSIIKEYESLPKTDLFSRLFNKESKEAYKRKQELNPQYEQAKDAQTRKRLSDLGLSESEVRNAYNLDFGNGGYYLPQLLKKAGVTDKKEYNDLYSALDKMFTRTAQSEANERNIKLADEHPVIGSALTVPGKMITGAGNAIESGVNYLTGNPLSNTSGSLAANKNMNEMRGAVSDDMSGVGKFLYGSGMSMADMLANRWLLGPVGNVSMGFEKGADTMNEAIDQGLNPTQIMGKGLASGATTYITEKMLTTKSLDAAKESILDLLKESGLKALGKGGIVKVLLPILAKSGVAEGTQEGLENIADTIADVFIAGGKNELTQSYNQYKANGLSNDEALKKVAGDKALELLEDTAGGFLSGFVMGGAEMGKSGIEYNLNNRNNVPGLNQQNTLSVDKNSTTGYNQGTTTEVEKGVSYDGREESSGYDGRRSDRLLRELPTREQQGIDGLHSLGTPGINTPSGSSSSSSVLGYDNKVFSEDMDVDPSVSSFDFRYSNNNAQDFHDAFEAAKASNDHGGAVDSHSIEDLQQIVNDGGNLFMSADKTAFGAVTGDGNLTSVAKAKNSPHKAAAMNVAKTAVKLGATKGDCYGKALVNMYAPAGFKPVARCEYVFGFNDAMDAQVREQLENGQITKAPDVYALVYDNTADTSKKYSQSELDALPLYEGESAYDDMLAYRDSLIAPTQGTSKTYDTKKVSDKSLNKALNDNFNMFGNNETGTALRQQLKAAINEYEDTKSEEAYAKIVNLCEQAENLMKNATYTRKKDAGKRSGKVQPHGYPWFPGTVTERVMDHIENMRVKDTLVNNVNEAYSAEIKDMANVLTEADADISAWDSLSEVKESFDNYVKTGDETYLETAMTAVEEMARSADISYSQVQKAFENGLTNAMKAEENKSLPAVNKVMKEDVGINGRDEEIDDGPIRLVEPVGGGIPDIRTRNTYTSKVARNTLEKFYSQDEKSYQRLVDNVLEGKHQVELQQMKDTNSKAVERIEKYSPDTTYEDIMRNGVNSAEDVALVHNLMKWYQAQGDFDKVDMLAIKLTHGGHNIGQTLQYFKAFGDSALGMNQATDTLAGSKTKEFVNKAKKHPNGKIAQAFKQNAKLAAALQQIEGLGQMEKAPKTEATYQQILNEVRNTLAKESASFEDRFSDTDVEYLARLIRNGASTADIKNALDRHLATGYFGMSQEDLQAITELYNKADKAKTSKERAELKEQAAAIAAKYSGSSTFMDKWNAWRYLAMLGNPRTLIRNRLGNFTFRQVTNIKDFVAAGLENAAQAAGIKFDRTKSMSLNPVTDAELFKASRADFDNVAYEEATRGGSKYNMKSAVEGKRQVFKTKGIEWLRDKVSNQLEQDDIKALKAKYTQALAGYLKANGYGADVLKTDNTILDKARAYAIQQAKIATFHEDSKTANLLNDLERRARESGGLAGKTAEILMESTMPFKKTPINILKQGVQYSPASLISAVYHIATKADANVWIDDLAKSLTGTGIMWLGYILGNSGLLVGQRKDEDDPFNKGSNYALNIGDKSITIDWLAPAALPLFVGCELANSVSDKSESGELALLETVASISEPVVEMSMMQGLESALSSLSNTKNFKGATFLENVATGYASQVIPTLSGQIARTIDPLRRTTRTNVSSYNKPLGAALEKAKQKAVNKLPGLSMTNEPYLNAWGETEKNASGVFGGNVLGRALQNFVLPGYVNDTSLSSREKGLAKLEETYKKNGYSGSLIPSLADDNKPNGTRLSNEDYTRWAQTRGNEMKKAVDAGLLYKGKISTKELQDYMHDLELLANAIAKYRQFGTEIPKTYKKKYEAYKQGGYSAVMKYLIESSK